MSLLKAIMERVYVDKIMFSIDIRNYAISNLLSLLAVDPDDEVTTIFNHFLDHKPSEYRPLFTTEKLLQELNEGRFSVIDDATWTLKVFNMIFSLSLSDNTTIAKAALTLIRSTLRSHPDVLTRISIDVFAKIQVLFSKNGILNKNIIEDCLLLFEELAQFNRKAVSNRGRL